MSESSPYIPPIIPGVNTLLEGEYRSPAPFALSTGEMYTKSVTVHPPEHPAP